MRFLIDEQLPPALARMIATRGHVAEHVQDVGLGAAKDARLWEYALEHHSVIVTKDEDFPSRLRTGVAGPQIVWLRVRNVSRQSLLQWFEPLLPQIEDLLQQGESLIEVR